MRETAEDLARLQELLDSSHAAAGAHLPGEELAVTVHGTAVPVDVRPGSGSELRNALLEIYVPRYGASWAEMLERGATYWRIDPERIYAFHMPE